jgi:N-acetylmuramoyl-L-alanine amidase
MQIRDLPSPNYDERGGRDMDILLLHYTGMRSAAAALARLTDPASKVSAHYVVDEDGTVYRLVAEEKRAWHAGVAYWAGARDINARSIGIEIVNPGHEFGYRPFPAAQMAALRDLCRGIVGRWQIPKARLLAHSDVAPQRKEDPGELFDWAYLAEAGVGYMPKPKPCAWNVDEFFARLGAFGYDVTGHCGGTPEQAREAASIAFCRHFRPKSLSATPDADMMAVLNGLIDSMGASA